MDLKVEDRIKYADVLRALAIVAVVLLHVAAPFIVQYGEVSNLTWWSANIYNSSCRWVVPVFIMLSGMLVLKKDKSSLNAEYIKNKVMRVLIPLLVWTVLYFLWRNLVALNTKGTLTIYDLLRSFVGGGITFHLWFIFLIIGLYLLTPIIKLIVDGAQRKDLKYFILLWFIWNSVFVLINKFAGVRIKFNLEMLTGYVGYYILGYYLNTYPISKKLTQIVYLSGIVGLLVTILGTFLLAGNGNEGLDRYFYNNFSPNVVILAIAVFLFIKNVNWKAFFLKRARLNRFVTNLAESSFGIYIIHMMVIWMIGYYKLPVRIYSKMCSPIIAIPFTAITAIIMTYLLVRLIKKVPVLRTLLV